MSFFLYIIIVIQYLYAAFDQVEGDDGGVGGAAAKNAAQPTQ